MTRKRYGCGRAGCPRLERWRATDDVPRHAHLCDAHFYLISAEEKRHYADLDVSPEEGAHGGS